ncbi:alkaline phosphatase [Salininema proteolyticum]|uniref:Alkaline phosphatase n=1 Tax=Salininema proteolyticum TaxID=1607685 RepID=A0ABV8TSH1_9ACTN
MSSSDSSTPRTSRRGLFKTSAGVATASAVFIGLGSESASAAPSPASPAGAKVDRSRLSAPDPHDFTGRTERADARFFKKSGKDKGDIAITILPIDRAVFRAGGRFDLRIEVAGVRPDKAKVELDISGPESRAVSALLAEEPERTSAPSGELVIEYKGMSYPEAGDYTVNVRVKDRGAKAEASASHEVRGVGAGGAKNLIFFLGDGMGQAPITAARVLSRGLQEGKYNDLLHMDRMDYRGFVGTSGMDALATDSANSMSAYMTGHKSSVNALGVYESSEEDPNAHPRVETMAELVKRTRGMKVGIVTTAEIQDATPAAVFAHTRRRAEKAEIMDQALRPEQMPDVFLGGGTAYLLPQSEEESKREDDRDLRKEFEDEGFAYVSDRSELNEAVSAGPERLLGTFHPGNMNVYLDREHSKSKEVLGDYTDQPTLKDMFRAAVSVLEKGDEGFVLIVEGASIDKMSHPMDGPRAVYDTIEFDQTVGLAREWAEGRDDTLIVATADHNHSMSIVGTHDTTAGAGRDANGVYADARYPTYTDSTGDGFPDDPNPDVQLFFGWSNHPDHSDDFQHNDVFRQPALRDEDGNAVDNPDRDPDAELQTGNLPLPHTNCVHTVDDVPVFASGPGAEEFNAFNDNTELFHKAVDALGIDAAG